MNELEKLREEIVKNYAISCREARQDFDTRMKKAMEDFMSSLDRAREIERQAGIGEEK